MRTAPYEVASNPRTLKKGKYLYLDGKKYLAPRLTAQEWTDKANKICELLKETWYERLIKRFRN